MFIKRKKAQAEVNHVQVADVNPRHEMAANGARGQELEAGNSPKTYSELEDTQSPGVKKPPVELPAD